ncbi:MAG: hypothetical protein JST04_00935 [Bdellovibrionales bacterium]|nr:hypothetical protein [Bdellovibrionales bacterium]
MNFTIHKEVTKSKTKLHKGTRDGGKTPDTAVKIPAKVKVQLDNQPLSITDNDEDIITAPGSVRYFINSLDKDLRTFIRNGKIRYCNVTDSRMVIRLDDGTSVKVEIYAKYHHYLITNGNKTIFNDNVVPSTEFKK